jgi:hypothetical protein
LFKKKKKGTGHLGIGTGTSRKKDRNSKVPEPNQSADTQSQPENHPSTGPFLVGSSFLSRLFPSSTQANPSFY